MSKTDAWMPFYVGDYLSATGRLTTEQHGAYLLLLLDYWKNGPPPANDAILAQIARLSPAAWRKSKAVILSFFEEQEGLLIQKRVERERSRTADVVEKRSKAGKASAAARAKVQQNGNTCSTHVETNGHQKARQSQSQSHSSIELIASSDEDVSAEPTSKPLSKQEVIDAWQTRMVPLGFPAIARMTGDRERKLNARLKDSTIDEWQRAMDALERSAFCKGENDRGWRADFDFLLQPKSFTGLLEGKYDH